MTITSRARFLKDMAEHSYRMAFIVLADNLSDKSWNQSNYYSDQEPTGIYTQPFWDLFVGKKQHLNDLVFNDIALAMTDYKGVEQSLPESIVAGETYEYSYIFGKDDLKNIRGQEIVKDYGKVRCVAMIVDCKSGRVANCISTPYLDGSNPFPVRDDIDWTPVIEVDNENGEDGVDCVNAESAVVGVEFFNMNGIRIENPAKGDLLIRSEILENGAIRYSKIIF